MKPIVCIIGPSGSGKTTLVNEYQKYFGANIIISHTTRLPREGEVDGIDYYFVNDDEYSNIEFVENITYNNYRYGLAKDEVEYKLACPGDTMAIVTFEGYEHLKEFYPVLPVYLDVDLDTQLSRLNGRGDGEDKVRQRISLRDTDIQSRQKVVGEGGFVIDANGDVEDMLGQLIDVIFDRERH